MKKPLIASLMLAAACASAHAGDWPEVGDTFYPIPGTGNDLLVKKVETRPTVDHTRICLADKGAPASVPCVWKRVGSLPPGMLLHPGATPVWSTSK